MPGDYWDMTLREVTYVIEASAKQKHEVWDVARTIGTWILQPHTKKKIKPRDLVRLPIDVPVRIPTRADFEQALEDVKKWHSKGL